MEFLEFKNRKLSSSKLKKGDNQVYYWKNGTEIDFLLFDEAKVQQLINVTTTVDDPHALQRELKSLELGAIQFPSAKQRLVGLYNESNQKDLRIKSLLDFLVTPPGVEPEFTG